MFKKLNVFGCEFLEAKFSVEEIKSPLWESDGDKIPGPDNLIFEFIQKLWNLLGGDIVIFTEEFYRNAKLPKAITVSFITLILKCLNPQKLADYIQIWLIGCLQKVLPKNLVARLKKILYKVISCSQMACVLGRKLLD